VSLKRHILVIKREYESPRMELQIREDFAMDPVIKIRGFDPEPQFIASLHERLERISELCPYDSSLILTIAKMTVQYEFSIVLHFVGGRMDAESLGPSLDKVTIKTFDKLYARICQWHTERFDSESHSPTSQAASRGSKPTVLIVDDDPISTQFLDHCLKRSGCQTHSVDNGHAAIEAIASNSYDLVFLDWNMPGMNGSETLLSAENLISYDHSLNSRFAQQKMPVITYSGEPRNNIRLPECHHFRFVDHWDKSTPFHQLLNQASDVLFRFKTGVAKSM
jgi:CheY-like chemotaxis protein